MTLVSGAFNDISRLTQTERHQPEYDQARVEKYGVLYRGVLEIKKLTWLTEKACKRLQEDLRQRDVESRIRSGGSTRSTLTLQALYNTRPVFRETQGAGLKIKVLIQGEKSMTAGYLTCEYPATKPLTT